MPPAFVSSPALCASTTSSFTSSACPARAAHPFPARPLPATRARPAPAPMRMAVPAPGQYIGVAVLGATGSVGQRFMQLLAGHPWFKVVALGASSRSAGKTYKDAVSWKQSVPIPEDMADIVVSLCDASDPAYANVDIVFSGMDNSVADEIEVDFAAAGKAVFSNAKCHRMDSDVPILIPSVNADHLDVIPAQRIARGFPGNGLLITNANCSTTALSVGIKPIVEAFGIDTLMVTTMQAISGAGYPGLSSMDILDNVVPLIGGEEPKMESESQKIFGSVQDGGFKYADFRVSAMCNRVNVLDGHTECVSLKLGESASPEQVIKAIQNYPSVTKDLGLPSAPDHDVLFHSAPDRPQPRLDRMVGNGYSVTAGRVRDCNVFDIRMVLFGHNTIVGAAGGSLLNAELCVVRDLVK